MAVQIINHNLDIKELKLFVDKNYSNSNDNMSLKLQKLIDEDSVPDFSVKHYFDRKHYLYLKNIVQPFFNKSIKEVVSAWTVYGYEGLHHRLHNHIYPPHSDAQTPDYTCLIYLNLPEGDLGDFFYLDKDLQEHIIEPDLNKAFFFQSSIFHGTYPQGKGLRQTLNIEFLINEDKTI